jgi:predicted DsbA family dithiol-disulfide isomerase
MTLDFFFDPGCPWTWRTSRWVTEVAPHREVAVRWRAYSLDMKNEKSPTTAQGALRIVEAVWVDHGDEPIGRLYTEVGTRFHLQQDTTLDALAGALEEAGLDADYLTAAHDKRWDGEIRWSMDEAIRVVGDDVGVPILVFDGELGLCGPVMEPRAVRRGGARPLGQRGRPGPDGRLLRAEAVAPLHVTEPPR